MTAGLGEHGHSTEGPDGGDKGPGVAEGDGDHGDDGDEVTGGRDGGGVLVVDSRRSSIWRTVLRRVSSVA